MPPFQELKGKLIEFHGSENTNLTACALKWLGFIFNSNEDAIAYYADFGNSVSSKLLKKNKIDTSRFILANNLYLSKEVLSSIDIIVLDDLTLFNGAPKRAIKEAAEVARDNDIVFLILNQKRNILNHETGIFEEKVFYQNYITDYADITVNLDTVKIEYISKKPELCLDPSISFLEKES